MDLFRVSVYVMGPPGVFQGNSVEPLEDTFEIAVYQRVSEHLPVAILCFVALTF